MVLRAISGLLLASFTSVVLMVTWSATADAQMTAPANVVAEEGGIIGLTISAVFSLEVTALVADLSNLPPSSEATFSASPDNTSGMFHWEPLLGTAGTYDVVFTATLANGWVYTRHTTVYVVPEGTTAIARAEQTWLPPSEGLYEINFVASDQGGTSTLTVGVSMEIINNCYPDSRQTVGSAPSPSLPSRAGSRQELATSEPSMSYWGKANAGSYCFGYGVAWNEPIDLHVEAVSHTPGSDLTLTSDVNCVDFSTCGFPTELFAREPRVAAPATAQGDIDSPLAIHVDASDPDGDPIARLTADLSDLPSGNDAVFTEDADHAHGILTWTPAMADSGDYTVEFRATNEFAAAKTTAIHVRGFNVTGVPAGTAGRSPAFSAVVRPNPLSVDSKLQLVTTRPGPVRVRLFDAQGRLVRELLAETAVDPGDHQLRLGMVDGPGRQLHSGVYFYRVEAVEGVLTGRLAVLR